MLLQLRKSPLNVPRRSRPFLHGMVTVLGASTGHKIPSLDGLRAVSIALVIFAHSAGTPHSFSLSLFYYTGELGVFGVKIFFVISGFLITTLLIREREKTGGISLRNFYVRRILRIFPAFYTYLLALLALNYFHLAHIPFRDFFHAATFTANFFGISWELVHIWSLSIEEQFYLLWPLSLVLFGLRMPLRIMSFLVIFPPLFFGFGLHEHTRMGEAISGLAGGCILAGARPQIHRSMGYLKLLSSNWTPIGLGFVLLAMESLRRFWFYELLTPIITVGIVLLVDSVITFEATPAGRLLNRRGLIYVGALSYSLYLWQEVFLNQWGSSWFNVFPVNVACAVACGLASSYLIERPFLRIKDRLKRGRQSQIPSAPKPHAQIA